MAVGRLVYTLSLVHASLIGYSSEQYTAIPISTYCSDYCNSDGDWVSGPWCPAYCCGDSTFRYCCEDSSLDVSDIYPDVGSCTCHNSDCYSTPIWEYVLYFFAPLTFFAIIAVCCCQCWYASGCKKCKKTTDDNVPTRNRIADTTSTESTTTLSANVDRNANQHLDVDFTYQMEPPSYETVTQDLPKYEDIVNETRGYDGPFEFTESALELFAPPAEYDVVASPSSEQLSNDAPPPSYTSSTQEVA